MLYSFLALMLVVVSVYSTPIRIDKRAVSCPMILANITLASGEAETLAYCTNWLAIRPRTTTTTAYSTTTMTTSLASLTTIINSLTQPTRWTTTATTTTTSSTITPSTRTTTATAWSTAYLNNQGGTITVLKRAEPTADLSKRYATVPRFFAGMTRMDLTAACKCLNIPNSLYVRTYRARPVTITSTTSRTRTLRYTTTLDAPIGTTCLSTTQTMTVTAAYPVQTIRSTSLDKISGCFPGTTIGFFCPVNTAVDDLNDPNFLNCGVQAQDGYTGYCLYWADDGSPAGSTLHIGDGSNDPTHDQYRIAIYSTQSNYDCPAWADWSCTSPSQVYYASAKNSSKPLLPHTPRVMPNFAPGLRGGQYVPNH